MMISFAAIIAHLLLNYFVGRAILKIFHHNRIFLEEIVVSLLLGIYVETLTIACLVFLGYSLTTSFLFSLSIFFSLTLVLWGKNKIAIPHVNLFALKWYEWLLLITIAEKFSFIIWQLIYIPLYFDDALHVWSVRGRSLWGGLNWSLDPQSPMFLGHSEYHYYPLGLSIWRAATAAILGEWNDIVGRGDGIAFYFCVIATAWLTVWRFSRDRRLSAAAAFIVSALPLQAWHAASGYADIAVEAFAFASLSALLRGDWFLAGMLAAGTAWSKNGSLALHIPGLMLMAGLLQFSVMDIIRLRIFQTEKWRPIVLFSSGLMTLLPWITFQHISSKGLTLKGFYNNLLTGSSFYVYMVIFFLIITVCLSAWGGKYRSKIVRIIFVSACFISVLFIANYSFTHIKTHASITNWRPGAVSLFLEKLFLNPSHGIFWIFTFSMLCLVITELLKDKIGQALFALFLISMSVTASAYCCTIVYNYLVSEGSIHRNLLHFCGMATIVVSYGVSLKYKLRQDFS